jgi:hypothetical protein
MLMSEIAGARAELTADFLLLFPWELSKRVIVKEHLKAMKSRLAQLAVALFAIAPQGPGAGREEILRFD